MISLRSTNLKSMTINHDSIAKYSQKHGQIVTENALRNGRWVVNLQMKINGSAELPQSA
jgi:hypothetical protein